jgi:hypothetical protein
VPYTSLGQLDHAAREYSWSNPPRRSWRTILPPTGSGTAAGTGSGQRCSRPWCGHADAILAGVELQADSGPRGRQDWSEYTRDVVYDQSWSGRAELREHSAATASLVEEAGRLTRPLTRVHLPNTDLVHGDFNFGNIVVRSDGGVAFLDMEQAGRGTRVYDLAVLLMVAGWDVHCLAGPLRKSLRLRAASIAGPEVLLMCSASVSLDWARFDLTHWPAADIDSFARWRVEQLRELGSPQ